MPATRASRAGGAGAVRHRVSDEHRRRQRHFARRRRDLIEDGVVALAASLALIVMTAGLGVLALFMVPLMTVIAASVIAPRVIRRGLARSRATRPRRSRR